jgi:pimeloyl-ACP methyl ester carboxylesterase
MPDTDLLLLPGLLCDRAVFEPILPALEPHVRCHVPVYHDERSLAAMAHRALRDAPERFALLGHSMGGRVALEILRTSPQRVSRVALLDSGHQARADGDAGARERAERLALLDVARTQGMRAMGRRWVQRMVHPDRLEDAPLIDAILDMIERRNTVDFAAQIQALLARPDAGDVLAAIDIPAMVLCGREDGWSPLPRHEEMAAGIRNAKLVVVEHCGHMCTMERPEAVAAAIVAWLGRPDRG